MLVDRDLEDAAGPQACHMDVLHQSSGKDEAVEARATTWYAVPVLL